MSLTELWKIRMAMSSETKEALIKGADDMAVVGAYCKVLVDQKIMPQDVFDAFVNFGALILLIGEGPGK